MKSEVLQLYFQLLLNLLFNLLFNFELRTFQLSSSGQRLPPCLDRERQKKDAEYKHSGGDRNGHAETAVSLNCGADEKHHGDADEAADGADEGDGAGAAVGRVLLGQPQRVEREVRAADAEEENQTKNVASADG